MGTGMRVGVVDDHPATSLGVLAALAEFVSLAADCVHATTVDELLIVGGDFDVVVLDLRLQDGTVPEDNVRRVAERGWPVVLYTQEGRPSLLSRCLKAGARGVVGKHEDIDVLAQAVTTVGGGDDFMNATWAAAIEALAGESGPDLAPREVEVLRLYAAGMPMKSVARRIGVAEETAKEYLGRLRRKYLDAGRPALTKTDLYLRAVEDGHLPGPSTLP